MRPATKAVVARRAAEFGVPVDFVVGRSRRNFPAAVAARRAVICELWNPASFGMAWRRSSFVMGMTEIAREIGVDRSAVLYALRKGGVYPPRQEVANG